MKNKCDNHCETCPMQTQIHCALVYAKATNTSVGALDARIAAIESRLQPEQPTLLIPIQDSANLPAQEQEETLKPQSML
jgi:hypothetical protein